MTSSIYEPPIIETDTKPIRANRPNRMDSGENEGGGCLSRLFGLAVFLGIVVMFVAGVALAGFAGARDGRNLRLQAQSGTLTAGYFEQATLAYQDLDNGLYELALERCNYLIAQQVNFPGADECIRRAQVALAATNTPTPTPEPTAIPATNTPPPTAQIANPDGTIDSAQLLALAQTAFDSGNYTDAEAYLEALRGQDANFERSRTEALLFETYLSLAAQYKASGELSQMVIAARKAGLIRSLDSTDWQFTINTTELYLSAKGYLDAQNYAESARVFGILIQQAPTYLDTKVLACEAFTKANDTTRYNQYCAT